MTRAIWEYGEGQDPIPAIDEPTVIFMINKTLHEPGNDQKVYEATRCCWKIGAAARERAHYALGVSHGVVRGAYRIDRWSDAGDGRWRFDGRPAPELNVVGTSIVRLKGSKGQVNPVRLFLDGIPAGTSNDG